MTKSASTWFPSGADYPESRLFALDALRGLDMFLLTVVGPLVVAVQSALKCFSPGVMRQFNHFWGGFTLWDIIMPLFIFMCGAAMPFALGRRLRESKGAFWRHVLSRVALLWFMGGLVQGNWAALDPQTFSPFANTLQSIAVGYLATAILMTFPCRWMQIGAPLVLAVGYTALLAVFGDYSRFGNFAFKVDHAVLSALLPQTNSYVARPSDYTWFLTSLMFAVMTMCGYHASMILRSSLSPWKRAVALTSLGAGLLATGAVASIWIPVIKHIYTLSFTAYAMGWCAWLLALLYVFCDILQLRRGWSLILLFGQCALTAYFVSHFFRVPLRALAETVFGGLASWCGDDVGSVLLALAVVLETVVVMLLYRRWKSVRRQA